MSLLGAFGGGIRGFLTGGPVGAITGVLGGLAQHGAPSPAAPFGGMPIPTFAGSGSFSPFDKSGGGILQHPFGGGATTAPAGGCPRGYHLNKHALAASKRHGAAAPRTMCVRNRSMNPMNYRALTRSLSRIKRASKIVRKLHKFNAPSVSRRRLSAPVAISENLRITSGK